MSRYLRLKDLGRWLSGGTPPRNEDAYWKGPIPWVSAKDFVANGLRKPSAFISADAARRHSTLAPSGSLLLIVRGMALAHGLQIAQANREVAFNQDLRALICGPTVNPRFTYYALLGQRWRLNRHIDRAAHGTARVTESVYAERILLPELSAQARISEFLERECERIRSLQTETELLGQTIREDVQGAFVAALEGHLHDVLPLRRMIRSISDGPFGSSLASEHYVDEEEVRVIRLGNVGMAEFVDSDRAWIAREYAEERLARHLVEAGDIIVAGLGDAGHPLGRSCVVPVGLGPAVHKADCYRVVTDPEKCLPEYVALALTFGPAAQEAPLISRGATRSRLNTVVARDLPVPLPSLHGQRVINEVVRRKRNEARGIIDGTTALAASLTEYRNALITEAVMGEFDVTRLSEQQLDEAAQAAAEGERPEVLST